MKKSGNPPNPRVYTAFFSSVRPESVSAGFLDKIHAIYRQWQDMSSKVTDTGLADSSEPAPAPSSSSSMRSAGETSEKPTAMTTNAYLKLLSQLSPPPTPEEMLAIFTQMPRSGLLAPTKETYTILLFSLVRQCGKLVRSDPEAFEACAATIWKIWYGFLADRASGRLEMDARSCIPFIRFLSQRASRGDEGGRAQTRRHAVQFVQEVLGLDVPWTSSSPNSMRAEEDTSSSSGSKSLNAAPPGRQLPKVLPVEPDSREIVYELLQLSRVLRSSQLTRAWFKQLQASAAAKGRKQVLFDGSICELVMGMCPDMVEGKAHTFVFLYQI